MKGYLLFVLLFIFNCDMSTTSRIDNTKISLWFLNVNSNTITINNSSGSKPGTGSSSGTFLSSCDLDCLETISGKYFFNDNYPDPNYCYPNGWSSGNNNGVPEPGENGVLQIPLIYYGNNPLPKLEAELIPDNPNIKIFGLKTIWYPALPKPNRGDSYYSCINTYYEEWGTYSSNSVCNTDYRHQCLGWKVQIPNNFYGYVDFKIIITSNIGSKVLKYRL